MGSCMKQAANAANIQHWDHVFPSASPGHSPGCHVLQSPQSLRSVSW